LRDPIESHSEFARWRVGMSTRRHSLIRSRESEIP
jgi:hypothetical protein